MAEAMATETGVLFRGRADDPGTLQEVLGQAMGAASTCWVNTSEGRIFDADRARKILDEALAWIEANYVPR